MVVLGETRRSTEVGGDMSMCAKSGLSLFSPTRLIWVTAGVYFASCLIPSELYEAVTDERMIYRWRFDVTLMVVVCCIAFWVGARCVESFSRPRNETPVHALASIDPFPSVALIAVMIAATTLGVISTSLLLMVNADILGFLARAEGQSIK